MSSIAAAQPRGAVLARPGRYLDPYPEVRRETRDFLQQRLADLALVRRAGSLRFARFRRISRPLQPMITQVVGLGEAQRAEALASLRTALAGVGLRDDLVVQALAHVGVEVQRLFGFALHDEQYFCAWLLLNGALAEMATGEGKSVTAAVAAVIAALAGAPVHVITTNDYLVERDARRMQPLFDRFGLSSGFASAGRSEEERRDAYGRGICYVSNKQLVFDYLRDRQHLGPRPSSISAQMRDLCEANPARSMLRGLCFAIVDEADSVLIDDAITPLILSREVRREQEGGQSIAAISLARRLHPHVHFQVDARARRVSLTEQGEHELAALVSGLDGVWRNRRYRLELVRQALSAIHLFQRDRDYLVRDGRIVLIDQSTGRVMADRKLQHGLHQMVETKEKCAISGRAETISSLSFQSFFRRYRFLCGMTGTASEAAAELRRVYGLCVVKVPTHHRSARIAGRPRFATDEKTHRALLLAEVRGCIDAGRPVLVGTRSLAESERISACLTSASVPHRVLNARQDEEEAAIVARAGERGAVTIATNMAGRGTDIPLGAGVREIGGLHVVVAELNDNRRVDRQLVGRGARQGDPGSFAYVVSMSDELLQRFLPRGVAEVLRSPVIGTLPGGNRLRMVACRLVQGVNERRQRRLRRQVALADREMNKRLSFSGYKE